MATMKEVANEAEVSIATVSRVINNSGYVSPDLEARVKAAMKTLNYQPSSLARSLRRQETQTIGVLIPQLDHPFFSRLCFAIEKALFASDYRALICSAEENREKENAYIQMLLRQRVDGVITVPTGHSIESIHRLMKNSVPVVVLDRDMPELTVSRVTSDNYQGTYDGTKHLIELGHTNIAVIGGPAYSDPMVHRIKGIRAAMEDHGLQISQDRMVIGSQQQFEMGYTATKHFLQGDNPPTAIFALTDVMAVGSLHAASEMGLKLPDDLSVIGFDDIPMAAYYLPSLTTIAQPIYEMGEVAVKLMLKCLREPKKSFETVRLNTRLVKRQSTAQPR